MPKLTPGSMKTVFRIWICLRPGRVIRGAIWIQDEPLSCHDCCHADLDAQRCTHDCASEFRAYAVSCGQSGAQVDASDCPGFEMRHRW